MDAMSYRERRPALSVLAAWEDERLSHGFLGRIGGFSAGPFAELNFSYLAGDDKAAVDANWARFRETIPDGARVVQLRQVHGDEVRVVTAADDGIVGAGDGMVTTTAGIALCVLSADCVPILMADSASRVVGAIHAGWRGVMADIAAAGVRAMVAAGVAANRLRAAMGPAIGGCCFEVDAELAERFSCRFPGAASHVRKGKPGKGFVDLKAVVRDRLIAAGLAPEAVTSVGPCTRCASGEFFSRRAAPDGRIGLQLSYIALRERDR